MSNTIKHPCHLVEISPWPLFASISAIGLTTGIVIWFHSKSMMLFSVSTFMMLLVIYQWWRDISREGSFQGLHTNIVEIGLRWGIILFITSEVIFFISFFWAFFHRSLSPNVELGCLWPPIGVDSFDPFKVPLINTIILLSSGVRVTWAHHALIEGDFTRAQEALLVTIFLGVYFTAIQLLEYVESSFSISDSSYGRTFFVATGFHGLHVLIGTLFLIFTLLRIMIGKIRALHHFGFEASAWYWHFVDVVWLFLFVTIYWWGGKL